MTREGFIMTSDVALVFFEICAQFKIDDYESRVTLLRVLVKENQAGYLRDAEEYVKDKRVLKIVNKRLDTKEKES